MKSITEKTLANGKRRVTLELDPGERLLSVRDDAHYKLGYPIEDIVASHILAQSELVLWCSLEQKWV